MLLAVLAGLAALLTLSLAGVFVFQRRTEAVPRVLRYLSVALLAGVMLVAGFAVLALYDEAAPLAVVFVAIVFVPLGAVGMYLHRTTELLRLDTLVTAGLAWSIPFLIGLTVTFGGLNVITSVFDLAPAESKQLGLHWIATAVGAVVAVLGTLWLGKHVSTSVDLATTL